MRSGEEEGRKRGRRSRASDIKSNNPHLAGGKRQKWKTFQCISGFHAIRDSPQPTSPIGFLFWYFGHRLVGGKDLSSFGQWGWILCCVKVQGRRFFSRGFKPVWGTCRMAVACPRHLLCGGKLTKTPCKRMERTPSRRPRRYGGALPMRTSRRTRTWSMRKRTKGTWRKFGLARDHQRNPKKLLKAYPCKYRGQLKTLVAEIKKLDPAVASRMEHEEASWASFRLRTVFVRSRSKGFLTVRNRSIQGPNQRAGMKRNALSGD